MSRGAAGRSTGMTVLDAAAFAELTERHRRELHVHCYRMLASDDDADDAVQELLLRAWRARDSFDGGPHARAWLYRIGTTVCLDLLRARKRRPVAASSFAEVPWLQPYPDRQLDGVPEAGPDAVAVARETVELAFLVALQVLPPRRRAALLARDVLGCTAAEAAALLGTSVPAANSAVQRARTTLAGHLPTRRADWAAPRPDPVERELLERFIDAHERCDAAAAPGTTRSGRSSSTSCGWWTAGSPRSRRSATPCSRTSACLRRSTGDSAQFSVQIAKFSTLANDTQAT